MKNRHTRELYSYWARLRGNDPAPARGAIEPADIRALLGDTFILEGAGVANYPFRLAGTRLCSLFGRELKGRNFLSLWSEADIDAIATLLTAVSVDAAAAVLGVEAFNDRGQSMPSELIVLPLNRGGPIHDRILGLMAPVVPASWLELRPVIRQSLTSLRLIWPDERPIAVREPLPPPPRPRAPTAPAFLPAMMQGGRRHQHLVVLDGGKQAG